MRFLTQCRGTSAAGPRGGPRTRPRPSGNRTRARGAAEEAREEESSAEAGAEAEGGRSGGRGRGEGAGGRGNGWSSAGQAWLPRPRQAMSNRPASELKATDAPRGLASTAADRGRLGERELHRSGLARGTRRRNGRRAELQQNLEALDWIFGVEHRPRSLHSLGGADAVLNAATDVVLERIRCAPDWAPTQDEAACALLRGSVGYSCEAADTTVAFCEFSHVALPPDARTSTYVVDLLGAKDCRLLEGWQETMLRSASERAELDQELGSIEPFLESQVALQQGVQALHRRVGPAGLDQFGGQAAEIRLVVLRLEEEWGRSAPCRARRGAPPLCWPRRARPSAARPNHRLGSCYFWEQILGGERRPLSRFFKAAMLHPRRSRDRMRQSSLENGSRDKRTRII